MIDKRRSNRLFDSVEISCRLFVLILFGVALVIGIAEDPAAEAILVGLTRDITCLPPGKALTIAEFAMSTVTIWKIRPDTSGAPRVRYWRHDWSLLRTWGGQLNEGDLLDRVRPEDDSRIVVARTGPEAPARPESAAEALRNAHDADSAWK